MKTPKNLKKKLRRALCVWMAGLMIAGNTDLTAFAAEIDHHVAEQVAEDTSIDRQAESEQYNLMIDREDEGIAEAAEEDVDLEDANLEENAEIESLEVIYKESGSEELPAEDTASEENTETSSASEDVRFEMEEQEEEQEANFATSSPIMAGVWKYIYNQDTSEAEIVEYLGAGGAVVIPASIEGHTVTRISSGVFNDIKTENEEERISITAVSIPETVTYIGRGCFKKTDVTSIVLPSKLTNASGILSDSKITRVSFSGEGMEKLPSEIFDKAYELKEVSLPEGLKKIDSYAFRESGIEKLDLSGTAITEIGFGTFNDCKNLSEVILPDGLETLGTWCFSGTAVTEIVIPATLKTASGVFRNSAVTKATFSGEGMEKLPFEIFDKAYELKEVSLPEGLKKIDSYAFRESGIEKLDLSGTAITEIGYGAFNDCKNLSEVILPDGLETLGTWCFSGTAVTEIVIPATLKTASGAFRNSVVTKATFSGEGMEKLPSEIFDKAYELKEMSLPEGLKKIDSYAFRESGIEKLDLSGTVITEIGYGAFSDCKNLREVTLPNGLETLGNWCFSGTAVTKIELPATLTSANKAFKGSQIRTVNFADGLMFIPSGICDGAAELRSVKLYDSVRTVKQNAFRDCNQLSAVFFIGDESYYDDLIIDMGNEPFEKVTPTNYKRNKDELEAAKTKWNEQENAMLPSWINYSYGETRVDIMTKEHRIETTHSNFSIEFRQNDLHKKYNMDLEYTLYAGGVRIGHPNGYAFKNISVSGNHVADGLVLHVVDKNSGAKIRIPLKLRVVEPPEFKQGSLELTDGLKVTIPGDVPIVGGDTVNLYVGALPVSVLFEDGKFKVGINIPKKTLLDSTKQSDLRKLIGSPSDFKDYLFNLADNSNIVDIPNFRNQKVELKVIGYAEGTWTDAMETISISLVAQVTYKYTYWKESLVTIFYIPIPVTVNFTGKVDGKLTGKVEYNFRDEKFSGSGTLELNATAEIYGGIGAEDLLSGGVYGNLTLGTKLEILKYIDSVYLKGEVGFKGYYAKKSATWTILNMGDLAKIKELKPYIDDDKLLLYSHNKKSVFADNSGNAIKGAAAQSLYGISDSDSIMLMDFTANEFQASAVMDSTDKGVLFENIYGGAAPLLARVGDRYILIYVDYVNTENTSHTMVMYAGYDPETGSLVTEPAMVYDDGTDDCNPVVYCDGNELYVAFMNGESTFDGVDPDIDEYAADFRITMAKYNQTDNDFDVITTVGEKLCYNTALYRSEDGITLAWAENLDDALLGMSDANTIYCVNYTEGKVTNKAVVAENLDRITNILGGAPESTTSLVYITASSNDLLAEERRVYITNDLYTNHLVKAGNVTQAYIGSVPGVTGEVFAILSEGQLFIWNGTEDTFTTLAEEGLFGGVSSIQSDNGILYGLINGQGNKNLCVVCFEEGRYSLSQLTDTDDYIDNFSVVDGNALYLQTEVKMYSETETGEMETTSSVRVLKCTGIEALDVDGVDFRAEDVRSESQLPVTVRINNIGSETARQYTLVWMDREGNRFSSTEMNTVILPGESIDVEDVLALPESLEGFGLTAYVYLNDEPKGKGCELSLGFTDIAVEGTYISAQAGKTPYLAVKTENVSSVAAEVTTAVCTLEGEQIYSETETLDGGAAAEYQFDIADYIPADDREAVLLVTVSSNVEDFNDYNNTAQVVIYKREAEKISSYVESEDGLVLGTFGDLAWMVYPDGTAVIGLDSEIPAEIFDEELAARITDLTVTDDVVSIDRNAFAGCIHLEKIHFENAECNLNGASFEEAVLIFGRMDSTADEYAQENGNPFADSDAADDLYAVGVTLKEDIGLNFYLKLTSDIVKDSGAYVLAGNKKYMLSEAVAEEGEMAAFYCFTANVAPADVQKQIGVELIDGSGRSRIHYSYSVESYLEKLAGITTDEETLSLIEALSDYGYAAERYFYDSKRSDAAADARIAGVKASDFAGYRTAMSGSVDALSYEGGSLVLGNRIGIRHYFKSVNEDTDGLTFMVDGKTVEASRNGELWSVEIPGILPQDILHSFEMSAVSGEMSINVGYGAMSYADTIMQSESAADERLVSLVKAIYRYAKAAEQKISAED